MQKLICKFPRWIAEQIPGNPANIAARKRELELKLRADGWSRKAAQTEAALRIRREIDSH